MIHILILLLLVILNSYAAIKTLRTRNYKVAIVMAFAAGFAFSALCSALIQ